MKNTSQWPSFFKHTRLILGFLPFLILLLTSCQQFSKSYCEKTNWRKEAFLLALSGENRDSYKKFAKKCAPHKTEIDKQVFNEGFDEGASQFCTNKAGLEYGKNGYPYKGTCQNINENDFIKNYIRGRLIFLNARYKSLEQQLEESDAMVWRKKNEYELEANTKPALAEVASDELESIKAENERIKADLEQLRAMITDLQKESIKDSPRTNY
jgi:hypothetical protein